MGFRRRAREKDFEIFVERCFGWHRQKIEKAGKSKCKRGEEHGRVRSEKAASSAAVTDDCLADGISALYEHPERTRITIEHFLTGQIAPGLYTNSEGNSDENSSLQWQRTRGWDQIRYVTPHGWTAVEVFLLLGDCLAREEDNTLIISSGIPTSWLSKAFSVRNLRPISANCHFTMNRTAADWKLCLSDDHQVGFK